MCVLSFVGDHYQKTWPERYPWIVPNQPEPIKPMVIPPSVSREEFNTLKREVEDMKRLLKAAKEIDEMTGQPDCEIEDKVALLRRVAEVFGISLDDVLGPAVNSAPTAEDAYPDYLINVVNSGT